MVTATQGTTTLPVAPVATARRRRRTRPGSRRGHLPLALLLIAPAVIGFAVFFAYPTVQGIYYSFTDFHVLSAPNWVGLANFKQLLADDVFWHSLWVTVYFVLLSVVFGILVSLVTAVIMHRLTRSTLIRGIVLLPFLISGVVAAMTWSWMLDPGLGIVNSFVGMTMISLTLTYLMQIYNALQRRNTLALAVHEATGETGDAADLIGAVGPRGNFSNGYTHLAQLAAEMRVVKESHHFYPVLVYFRFNEPYYTLSRLTTARLRR